MVGQHEYAIEMAFDQRGGVWYEISQDGRLLGERHHWPLGIGQTPISKEQLVNEKRLFFEERSRREAARHDARK